jgi:uncharacterized protein with PIN domain
VPADELEIRCYAELNDRLPPENRYRAFPAPLPGTGTVASVIAALGLPEREVDLALLNGRSVGFEDRLRPGDRLSLYPVFESLDISSLTRLPDRPLRDPRFVLDVHLGRLARLLRMLGFDTLWRKDWADRQIAEIAIHEGRILLTRDRRLAAERGIARAYRPRSASPREQLIEVCERFDLAPLFKPFSRCMLCNAPLEPVGKTEVWEELPERTRQRHDRFFRCTACRKVYWEGSHHRDMQALLVQISALRQPGAHDA